MCYQQQLSVTLGCQAAAGIHINTQTHIAHESIQVLSLPLHRVLQKQDYTTVTCTRIRTRTATVCMQKCFDLGSNVRALHGFML